VVRQFIFHQTEIQTQFLHDLHLTMVHYTNYCLRANQVHASSMTLLQTVGN